MKIKNVTGWPVESMYDGIRFDFEPFEEKEIYDARIIKHLARSKGYLGLVHMAYNEQMQAKYASEKEFVYTQTMNGLKSIKDHKLKAHRNEKQAKKECYGAGKLGMESDLALMDPNKFEKDLKEIESWITKAEQQKPKVENEPTGAKNQN
jgi:hypothetical protein